MVTLRVGHVAFVFTRDGYVQPERLHSDDAGGVVMVSMYLPRRDFPTDADLWRRVASELEMKGLKSLYAPKVNVGPTLRLRLAGYGIADYRIAAPQKHTLDQLLQEKLPFAGKTE